MRGGVVRYLTVRLVFYPKTDEIMGIDGIIYKLKIWEPITLPEPNAKVFLDGEVAELIDDHKVGNEVFV